MSDNFTINYKNHKACIQTCEGIFKIFGVKNQSKKEKLEFLQHMVMIQKKDSTSQLIKS